jgi:hypothetical protein
MWQWQYLRAQEIARERVAEADAWRRARGVPVARRVDRERRTGESRRLRRTLPSTEAGL